MKKNKKLRIGLTLSGGGLRAAAFHLGVLSRLSDSNLLEHIKMLSTVSGGTLLTGLIYHANNNKWPNSIEFKTNCLPYIKMCLTEKNLQLNALLRVFLWPYPHFGKGRASIISSSIQQCWNIKSKLNDIPAFPKWNINATTIESGKSWRFIPNNRMGDYILNYVDKPDIDLSAAMCSSAAVPFLIGPLKLNTKKYNWYKYTSSNKKVSVKPQFKKINVWDGGAYDNLGIEPLLKYDNGLVYRSEINFLFVSDAAHGINTHQRNWHSPVRLINVTMDQVRSLRARILRDHFKNKDKSGVYIKIGESTEDIRNKSNKKADNFEIKNSSFNTKRLYELKNYPTNLWRMKIRDFDDLVLHGWEVANASILFNCPFILPENNTD